MNSVITYIFGKNKEILREPKVIDENTEYICVTDQKNLASKKWKIIYDPMNDIKSLRDKVVYVKFNPFKYVKGNKICIMDSSFEIKSSLKLFFEKLNNQDFIFKKHKERDNLKNELNCWIKRGLSTNTIKKFFIMAKHDKIKLEDVIEIEGCLFLLKNNTICKNLCESVIEYMKFLSETNDLIVTNQCPLSYIIHLYYKEKCILFDFNFQKKFFNRYEHNTNKLNER